MAKDLKKAEKAIKDFLTYMGEDVNREGLRDTPRRYVKFMKEFLTVPKYNFTTFESEQYDEMIIVKNIPFFSFCEHHLAVIQGVGAVGYIPGKTRQIAGLSKLPRTLDKYSRRLQNQERITKQVAQEIFKKMDPLGVGVVLKARHYCMEMRGVQKHGNETITSTMLGCFKDELNCRQEFLNLINLK